MRCTQYKEHLSHHHIGSRLRVGSKIIIRGGCVTLRPGATNDMFKMSSQHGGMPSATQRSSWAHASPTNQDLHLTLQVRDDKDTKQQISSSHPKHLA